MCDFLYTFLGCNMSINLGYQISISLSYVKCSFFTTSNGEKNISERFFLPKNALFIYICITFGIF